MLAASRGLLLEIGPALRWPIPTGEAGLLMDIMLVSSGGETAQRELGSLTVQQSGCAIRGNTQANRPALVPSHLF